MKFDRRFFITILIGILVTTLALFAAKRNRTDLADRQIVLTMRWIGHQVLLKAGDSASRVLPVKTLGPTIFQLAFQSDFGFVPDTLVKIVHTSLTTTDLPLRYTVNVLKCATDQVVYGYRIGPGKTTLVPCLGRSQPKDCYVIQIELLEDPSMSVLAIFYGLAASVMSATALVIYKKRNRQRNNPILSAADHTPLGNLSFSPSKRYLAKGDFTISLTDKESRLLEVLVAHQNEPMDRERLLKEVWEDDGVIVGRSLDVFISKLRKKLTVDPTIKILNIHGKGYKLITPNP